MITCTNYLANSALVFHDFCHSFCYVLLCSSADSQNSPCDGSSVQIFSCTLSCRDRRRTVDFGTRIESTSFGSGWAQYVAATMGGAPGSDGPDELRELFSVTVAFGPGTDFAVPHPEMDLATQAQYVRKVTTTKIDPVLGGSYGYRLRRSYGVDQVEDMIRRISARPESKSACANLLHPITCEMEREAGMQRTACLAFVQALLRDRELALFATFRSQNAINSHGNFRGLHELQVEIAGRLANAGLDVRSGYLIVHINAAHVFAKDFNLADRIVAQVGDEVV
jgi:hypothetical protein